MTKDELRDLIVEGKAVIKKLNHAWLLLEDEEIIELTEIKRLPCDSCEEEKDGI